MRLFDLGAHRFTLTLTALIFCVAVQQATASGYQAAMGSDLFELGPAAGGADILGSAEEPGPDWADLFNAEKLWLDSSGDGTPDYVAYYSGQAAVFVSDDISSASGMETSALTQDGDGVQYAVISPSHDIGNAYLYATSDDWGNLVVYGAAERVGWGDTQYEFEFNQDHFRLGHGGYGVGKPWSINGERMAGDVMVRISFTSDVIDVVEVLQWNGDGFDSVALFYGEGCDPSQAACAASNAAPVFTGPWANIEPQLPADRFAEFGVNIGALTNSSPQFTTLCIRTPEDIAFGYFAEGN